MILTGVAHRYGDDVNTDVILPARYINLSDPKELASHCMEDIDPDFTKKIAAMDIIVAGENFGCGSSREHAPISIKESGISCVIAKSFARIFYRNAINIGLPIVECPEAASEIDGGEKLTVDFEQGAIINQKSGNKYPIHPFPEFLQDIISAGGLLKSIAKQET